jgi:Cu/Ag efflux protein CusF
MAWVAAGNTGRITVPSPDQSKSHTMHKIIFTLLVATTALAPMLSAGADKERIGAPATVSATPLTDGEVRRIDLQQGRITLKHGEIRNLSMPAMTMVFRAKDPAMLARLKVGDEVRFSAEQGDGVLILTAIEPRK